MKKIKEIIKNNIKTVIAFILGGIVFGTIGVYAATTLLSQSVYYNNTNSGASSTNVQGALDELFTRASKWVNPNDMGTPTNYIFDGTNPPTTSSPTTPPSGKTVYLGLYADIQYGVCIKRNRKQHCFRYNNWVAEAKHVQEVFSGNSCNVLSSSVICTASDFKCWIASNGLVYCRDNGAGSHCGVDPDGTVDCG